MFVTKDQLFKLLSQAFDAGQVSYAEMKEGCLEKIWEECEANFTPEPAKEKGFERGSQDVWIGTTAQQTRSRSNRSRFNHDVFENQVDTLKALEEVFQSFKDLEI